MALWTGSPTVALPGSLTAQPPGIEAVYTYNGLTFNDRKVVDKFRITRTSGLNDGGVDLRTNEEPNPSAIGANPLANFLGGRTFTIEGSIIAHNVEKLRDMEQALRTALYSTVERPLTMSRIYDTTRDVYIMCRIADKPAWKDEFVNTTGNHQRDFQIIMRASDPRIYSFNQRTYSATIGQTSSFPNITAGTSLASLSITTRATNGTYPKVALGPDGILNMLDMGVGAGNNTRAVLTNTGAWLYDGGGEVIVTSWIGFQNTATRAAGEWAGCILHETDASNYVLARIIVVSAGTYKLQISKVVAGVMSDVGSPSANFIANDIAGGIPWLWFATSGTTITTGGISNNYTAQVFSGDPRSSAATPLTAQLLANVTGLPAWAGNNGNAGWQVSSSSTTDHIGVQVASLGISRFGNDYPLMTVVNNGNGLAAPTINVKNGFTMAAIIGNNTQMPDENFLRHVTISGYAPQNSNYYKYSGGGSLTRENYTFTNQGVSAMSQVGSDSRIIQLAPGSNSIVIVGSNNPEWVISSTFEVVMIDTWI